MKKKLNALSLGKKTIANLGRAEMNNKLGGRPTHGNKNTCRNCTGTSDSGCTFGCSVTCSGGQVCIC